MKNSMIHHYDRHVSEGKFSNTRQNPLTGWPESVGRDEFEYPSIDDIIDTTDMSDYRPVQRKKWEKWKQLSLFPPE